MSQEADFPESLASLDESDFPPLWRVGRSMEVAEKQGAPLALFAPDGPAAMPLRDELPETFDVMPARDRLFATSRDAPFFGAISRGARGV